MRKSGIYPPCLRQTSPISTNPPLSLMYDRTFLPESTKFQASRKNDIRPKGIWRISRRWGIGSSGIELNACVSRTSAYGKEEISASDARCLITNRPSCGFPTIRLRTFSMCQEESETATSADFIPTAVEAAETASFPIQTRGHPVDTPFS